ncbi:MAG: gliding motility-associated C-terminal domain-containing protein [Flavobacteriales bacterium]
MTTLAAGTYDVTLTSVAGCDSIATLSLTINDVLTSTEDVTLCSNQLPYNWNGTDYTAAGTYDVTLTSIAGCDSIATLNLSINDVLSSTEDVTLCSNQLPYNWNGVDYTAAGTYDVTLTSIAGCDSIATLNLTINDVLTSTEDVTLCSNQLPYNWNGVDYTAAGSYDVTLISVAGCDSIATLNLTINDVLTSLEDVTICSNQLPYSWNGVDYTAAGTYEVTLTSVAGCDSIATLNLTINDVLSSTEDVTLCSNHLPYNWNGVDYTAAGTYDVTLTSVAGCDSIATLNLTINDVLTSTEDVTLCSNQLPYNWNGQNYSTAGSYTVTLVAITGCDSIATLNLDIIEVLSSTEEFVICNNQTPFIWNGNNYSATGIYTLVLTSVSGCDSIVNLNLIVNDVVFGEENVAICADALPYSWNGEQYSGGGTYYTTLLSTTGCDSVATLNLVVYDILSSTEQAFICENELPYSWNGISYTNSGIYQEVLQSVNGCDSIATLVLEVYPAYQTQVEVQICEGEVYTLPDGSSASLEGSYETMFSTINGCDSLIVTQLTFYENPSLVLNNLVGTNTLNCNIGMIEYSAISDGTVSWSPSGPVFTSAGVYIAMSISPNGCSVSESVEIFEDFDLPAISIINETGTTELTCLVEEIELTANGGIAYFWNEGAVLSNHITINSPGTYTVQVVGLNGCSDEMTIEITQDITPPVATITNLTGTDLLTCYNTEVELQGTGIGIYTWNGSPSASGILTVNAPGIYALQVTAANGCTDFASYEIYQNINTPEPTYLAFEICDDQSVQLPDGSTVNSTGTYNTVLPAWNGCDSLIVTNLLVHPTFEEEVNARICPGDEYLLPNGQSVSETGSYLSALHTTFGCDSLIVTNIEVLQTYDVNFNIVICPGESYALPDGTVTTEEGAYSQMLQSIGGCDSIVTFNLDIYQPVIVNQNVYICSGEIYQLPNGNFVNTTGNYAVALESVFGCDSTVVYHVNVNAPMQQFVNTSICQGTTYTLADGNVISQSGVYSVTVPSIAGCDSTIITNLSVQPDIDVNFTPYGDTLFICYGETVTLAGTGAQNYNWYPNDYIEVISNNTALASPPSDMMYYINGTTGSCDDGDSLYIIVLPIPDISALAEETILCQGDSTYIQAFGGDSYVWSPSLNNNCIYCEGAYVAPNETTTYEVTGIVDGCESSFTVTIDVGAEPIALLPPDTLICENESLVLVAQGGGTYLWNTGEETQSITVSPTEPNEYSVIVSIGSCSDTASINIGLLPLPDIYAGPDTSIVLGSTVTLDPSGGVDYTWEYSESLSCLSCTHPDANPIVTTTYVVIGENEFGCKSLDSVDVIVSVLCDNFFIPNAFAPAEGGHLANDCFKVFGTDCFDEYIIRIYNRWGQVVFESSNPEDCWDGTFKGVELNTAVFVYYFEGTLLTGEPYHQQGNVTLVK